MDDYMSEKFLIVTEEKPKKKLKRKFDDKPKSIVELQKERLEEGLSNPLDSTNKGIFFSREIIFSFFIYSNINLIILQFSSFMNHIYFLNKLFFFITIFFA